MQSPLDSSPETTNVCKPSNSCQNNDPLTNIAVPRQSKYNEFHDLLQLLPPLKDEVDNSGEIKLIVKSDSQVIKSQWLGSTPTRSHPQLIRVPSRGTKYIEHVAHCTF